MQLRTKRVQIGLNAPLGAPPLSVPLIYQEQTNWCWAACTEMILRYHNETRYRQCDFASWLFGQSGCCSYPSSSICNQGAYPNQITAVFQAWLIQSQYANYAVSYNSLDAELINGRPIEVAYHWSSGGGHVALVIETNYANGSYLVTVNDPWYGRIVTPYNSLLQAYGYGTWSLTWFGIRR
ncbi:papain-like cysteine protease family protein [Rhodococcus opacus]|uniref:papain-like cysteine protease family protein n=1 Tax=Rhodococcus opacus TaxID=37919 RepID=UPI00155A7731